MYKCLVYIHKVGVWAQSASHGHPYRIRLSFSWIYIRSGRARALRTELESDILRRPKNYTNCDIIHYMRSHTYAYVYTFSYVIVLEYPRAFWYILNEARAVSSQNDSQPPVIYIRLRGWAQARALCDRQAFFSSAELAEALSLDSLH